MASTPASRKAKGRRLQNTVSELLLERHNDLEPDDIRGAIMGESGEDIKMSPLARRKIPLSIECKAQERLSIWSALNQAEENVKEGTKPAVVFKRNYSKTYIAMEFEDFLDLLYPKRT